MDPTTWVTRTWAMPLGFCNEILPLQTRRRDRSRGPELEVENRAGRRIRKVHFCGGAFSEICAYNMEVGTPTWINKPFPVLPQVVEDAGGLWMERRTIPIYRMKPSANPLPHGTGVLFEIGDTMFILTAAHVLNVEVDDILLIWPSRSREHIALNSMERNLSKERNSVDLGIIRLSGYARTRILQEREAVKLSEIDIGPMIHNSLHAVFGYPLALSEPEGTLGDIISNAVLYPTV